MPDPLGCRAISFSIIRHLPPAAWILDIAWLLKLRAATVTLCSMSPAARTFPATSTVSLDWVCLLILLRLIAA